MVALDNHPAMAYTDPMQQIKVSVPDDLKEWVKLEARRRDLSESSIIRQALRNEQRNGMAEGKENGNG